MVDLKLEKKEEDWFFYIHEKRNSQEIEKEIDLQNSKKKQRKEKSFQAIDGSHPPLTLSPNGVWRRQSRLDQSPLPTKKEYKYERA